MGMKVVIIGSGEMLMSLIAGCEDANCKIVGVLRAETVKTSRLKAAFKNVINPSKDYTYVKSHNLNDLRFKTVNSEKFKKELVKLNPDLVIVGSWGEKFKKDIINVPKLGTINVHPSLLPKYRGPNPYIEVIRHRESETGVTFHFMNENFDEGPILHQKRCEILESDTSKELKTRVTTLAREGIRELLQQLDTDIIIPANQNNNVSTYFPRLKNDELKLDFTQNAQDLATFIRALHPFGKAYFANNSHFLSPNPYKLSIIENSKNMVTGQVYEVNPKERKISVVCGDNKVLVMKDVRIFGILRIASNIYLRLRIKEGKQLL